LKKLTPLAIAKQSAKMMWGKKAEDVVILNISKLTTVSDYFVIGTVETNVQMDAIIHAIKSDFRKQGLLQLARQELKGSSPNWQLLDYGNVVVHVMTKSAREFYSLERLWHKARKLSFRK